MMLLDSLVSQYFAWPISIL